MRDRGPAQGWLQGGASTAAHRRVEDRARRDGHRAGTAPQAAGCDGRRQPAGTTGGAQLQRVSSQTGRHLMAGGSASSWFKGRGSTRSPRLLRGPGGGSRAGKAGDEPPGRGGRALRAGAQEAPRAQPGAHPAGLHAPQAGMAGLRAGGGRVHRAGSGERHPGTWPGRRGGEGVGQQQGQGCVPRARREGSVSPARWAILAPQRPRTLPSCRSSPTLACHTATHWPRRVSASDSVKRPGLPNLHGVPESGCAPGRVFPGHSRDAERGGASLQGRSLLRAQGRLPQGARRKSGPSPR